jgi:glucose-1-phosphate adenylyltransferase
MVGLRSHISEGCVIEDTLLMGADFYENKAVCASKDDCFMPLGVGPGSTIKNAIVDKNARIGANCSITNKDNVKEDMSHETKGWVIKDYIVVIEKDAMIPDGTVI